MNGSSGIWRGIISKKTMDRRISHALKGGLLGIICGLLSIAIFYYPVIKPLSDTMSDLEAKTFDSRFGFQIRRKEREKNIDLKSEFYIQNIVIVDIDVRSLSKLGNYFKWSRSYHARVVDIIKRDGADAIGFDILFAGKSKDPEEDLELVRACREAGNVFNSVMIDKADTLNFLYPTKSDPYARFSPHSSYKLDDRTASIFPRLERIEGPSEELAEVSAGFGAVTAFADGDGVIRRAPVFISLNDRLYPLLGFAMVLKLLGIDESSVELSSGSHIRLTTRNGDILEIPIDPDGKMLIKYAGNFRSFQYISFYDVLEERFMEGFFRDKLVIIGASAPALFDLKPVPFNPFFPGVEIQANLLYNVLSGDFLRRASNLNNFAVLFLLCFLIGVFSMQMRISYGATASLALLFFWVFFSFYLFLNHNLWIDLVNPTIGMAATYTTVMAFRYFTEEREKKRVKNFFQSYVSKTVVDELLRNPELVHLGGQRKELTVFFSDIAGFTTMSEKMKPEDLVTFLNEYLNSMTRIIMEHGGTVDKFEGDAVMAFYGAPLPLPEHAVKACSACIRMQAEVEKLNLKWTAEGRNPMNVRMGVNTGEVVVGNMGSEEKMDYTVMGDDVNVASRLESINKFYKSKVMISGSTYQQALDKVVVREIDYVKVKGKTLPVSIYELIAMKDDPIDEALLKKLKLYEEALRLYKSKSWAESAAAFEGVLALDPEDAPSAIYLERCRDFEESPPPDGWDWSWDIQIK